MNLMKKHQNDLQKSLVTASHLVSVFSLTVFFLTVLTVITVLHNLTVIPSLFQKPRDLTVLNFQLNFVCEHLENILEGE